MGGIGPNGQRILEAFILAMAGLVASMGVTFGCLIRNVIQMPEQFTHNFGTSKTTGASAVIHLRMPGTGMTDIAITVGLALLMMIWVCAFVSYVRREPRTPITWISASLIGGGFVWVCWQNWLMAYPVCNAF